MKIKNRKLIIDLMNLFLAIGITLSAVAAIEGTAFKKDRLPVVFAMGTVMLTLNAAKCYQEHRGVGILFAVLSLVSAFLLIYSLLLMAFF